MLVCRTGVGVPELPEVYRVLVATVPGGSCRASNEVAFSW